MAYRLTHNGFPKDQTHSGEMGLRTVAHATINRQGVTQLFVPIITITHNGSSSAVRFGAHLPSVAAVIGVHCVVVLVSLAFVGPSG
jgi:hypothetical protein